MKVLHVINSLGVGGAEKLLLDIIPEFNRRNVKVDLLVLWDNDHAFLKKLNDLKCCNVYILNSSSNFLDNYSIHNVFTLKKIMKDYDVIHAHLFPAFYIVALAKLLLPLKNQKLLYSEHSTFNRRSANLFFRFFDKIIYSLYDKVICVSTSVFEFVDRVYKIHYKQILVQNGVFIDNIYFSKPIDRKLLSKALNVEDIIITQISSFGKAKDQQTLIRALHLLPKNYKLVLVGVGENYSDCRELTDSLNLNSRVCFLGVRHDVGSILKSSDIVVLSSNFEGLSLSSIEGMASGKPFIASNVPGLSDIVKNYGLLFEKNNPNDLVKQILSLENKEFYMQIVDKCLTRAKCYDMNIMLDSLLSVYGNKFKN
jgi:glycosyltransferase involved in cell wall biosynthesis